MSSKVWSWYKKSIQLYQSICKTLNLGECLPQQIFVLSFDSPSSEISCRVINMDGYI